MNEALDHTLETLRRSYPKTIDEAVDRLLETLCDFELEQIRRSDAVDPHFNLRLIIRNHFGLNDGSPLVAPGHMPDDVSSEIIEALKRRLDSVEK